MKLEATTEKVSIKWFAVLSDGSKMRNTKGFIHNAWDVECSCGWKTSTGGAIKAYITNEVFNHKWHDHNYQIKVGA
jgi:hypothetical protein